MDDLILDEYVNIENGLSESEYLDDYPDEVNYTSDEVSENEILYVVSDNGVTKEVFNVLIDEVRGLREDVKNKQYIIVSGGVSADNVSYNQAVSVSDNILYKPLKDYNTSESMALIGLVLAFSALIIYMIHKTIFRIKR